MNKSMPSRQPGFSLIELMISLTLGLLVTLAFTGVYQTNRGHYRHAEGFARMQEAGRFALDVLSRDLSLADFWGGFGTTVNPKSADDIPIANDCGPADVNRWAFQISNAIEYFMPASLSDTPSTHFQCLQGGSDYAYAPGTNALAVKHASGSCVSMRKYNGGGNYVCPSDDPPPQYEKSKKGLVYVRTSRKNPKFILSDGTTPTTDVDREYVVHLYYIAVDKASGIPSLRRKYLTNNAGIPAIEDESGEIAEGVEFFHIQFGVDGSDLLATDDTTLTDAQCNQDTHVEQYRSVTDTYKSSDHALRCAVSARIYVLVRSLEPDASLPEDKKTYNLGGLNAAKLLIGKDIFDDRFQRRVYTTTVQLRNRVYQSAVRQKLQEMLTLPLPILQK